MLKLSEKTVNYIKLSLTGIILIWLFIRSPFNPLYEDSSQGEMAFVKLNFVYWLLVSVFLVWIIYFVNKKNFDKYSLFIYTAANFLYLSFYIFYGFDVVDSGYHLSKQWAMYNGLWEENFDRYIAGTNLIGGLWLKLYGEPMLIWARLGFVIVQTAVFTVSYKILHLYFTSDKIFLTTFTISVFLSTWIVYFTINYDNLPFLFFSLSVYSILKGQVSVNGSKWFYISGLLYVLTAFCKVSYVPSFLALIGIIVVGSERNIVKKQLMYFTYGILSFLLMIITFILTQNVFNAYADRLASAVSELTSSKDSSVLHSANHSFTHLYGIYKDEAVDVYKNILMLSSIILIFGILMNKVKSFLWTKILVSLIIFAVVFYTAFDIIYRIRDGINVILAFCGATFLIWIISSDNKDIKKYLSLLTAAFFMFLFSFIGSDLGYRAAFHSGTALTIFSASSILIKESRIKIQGSVIGFKFLHYFILIALILNIHIKKDILFVESEFKRLSVPFESFQLRGIKSSPERVYAVDSLLSYLENISDYRSKKILFTHSNPMMYYLVDTNYFLESPWDLLNVFHTLENSLKELNPDLIIVPAVSHRLKSWPLTGSWDPVETRAENFYELYDKFIEENEYSILFNNKFYTVYGTSNGVGYD